MTRLSHIKLQSTINERVDFTRFSSAKSIQNAPNASTRLRASDYFVVLAIACFFFEGSVRKWVLPVNHWLTYPCVMSKEIAILIAIIMSDKKRPAIAFMQFLWYYLKIPLLLISCSCFFAATQDISFAGALLTVRALIVLPIATCFVWKVLDVRVVKPIIIVVFFCGAINAVLSWVQFNSSSSDWINCYVGGSLDGIATTGFSEKVRATGSFSYISGLGFGAILCFGVGLFAFEFQTGTLYRILGLLTSICGISMALATVSRGPMIFIIGMVFVYLFMTKHKAVVFSTLVLIAMVVLAQEEQTEMSATYEFLSATLTRSMNADSAWDRLFGPFYELINEIYERPFGSGLGLGQSAARRFGSQAVVETEFARVVYEIGILGFLGFALTYGGAVLHLLSWAATLRQGYARLVLIACSCLAAALLYGGVVFNHVSSMVFWLTFACGCMFIETSTSRSIPRALRSARLRGVPVSTDRESVRL